MGRGRNKSRKVWRTKVARVAKSVALRNLETKNFTVDIAAQTLYKDGGNVISNPAPLAIYPLKLIVNGTGPNDALGDEVTLKMINWRFMFRNASSVSVNSRVRIMIGWLKPNVVSIGNNWRIGTFGDSVSAFIRQPNDEVAIWKKLLWDKSYACNSMITGTNQFTDIHINMKMHNKKYSYDTASKNGTNEDLVALVTASIPDGTTLESITGFIDGYARIWYKDG